MGGIILIIIVVIVAVMARKIAAIALTLTGLDKQTANFQALSALTGTGFTTKEAELVTSHPVRRKIISLLMLIGNAGLIAVMAGLVSSFLTITSAWTLLRFIVLIVALYLVFKIATYTKFARLLSKKIEENLREKFKFKETLVEKVLDLGENFGIAEVILHKGSSCVGKTLASSNLNKKKILVLAIERDKKKILVPRSNHKFCVEDNLICYGSFEEMEKV